MFEPLKNQSSEATHACANLLAPYRDRNCFNPSLLFLDHEDLIAFRAFGVHRSKPFRAYLLSASGQDATVTDLSEKMEPYGIANVADPKLFRLGKEAWLTFNTGYSKQANRLYLLKIRPALEAPVECTFEGRRTVEKNWAFFERGGKLHALYSLRPLVILDVEAATPREIVFKKCFEQAGGPRRSLTIGTPLMDSPRGYLFIAHVKVHVITKRLYFGVPALLTSDGVGYALKIEPKRLIHDYRSLLGSWPKHNPNLISCTYFSGISRRGEEIVVSYGINDSACGFASGSGDWLWR